MCFKGWEINYVAHGGKKNTFQCTLSRQYCVFKVFDVISLKCISLCAQMWDYGHTKKSSHSEKTVKAHSSGLIEKKNEFTVNYLTDLFCFRSTETVIHKILPRFPVRKSFPFLRWALFMNDVVKWLFFVFICYSINTEILRLVTWNVILLWILIIPVK